MKKATSPKIRLDQLLLERNLAPSREKARAFILAGTVLVNGRRVDKPGTAVPADAEVSLSRNEDTYVSRGGYKLEAAVREFGLDFRGRIVLDAGASTGGFTDCALQNGAAGVWAVDVGYGQLAWKIRSDPRVTVLEKTNIRLIDPDQIPERFDIITVDVSFISLKLVLPVLRRLIKPGGIIVSLVKPQFEAGRDKVGKKGVVRDAATHLEVLEKCREYARENGLAVQKASFSPLKGPEGNIEFLFCLAAEAGDGSTDGLDLQALVSRAHQSLEASN